MDGNYNKVWKREKVKVRWKTRSTRMEGLIEESEDNSYQYAKPVLSIRNSCVVDKLQNIKSNITSGDYSFTRCSLWYIYVGDKVFTFHKKFDRLRYSTINLKQRPVLHFNFCFHGVYLKACEKTVPCRIYQRKKCN